MDECDVENIKKGIMVWNPEAKIGEEGEFKDIIKQILGECYENIIDVLRMYSDIKEDYYHLVATWIIGTYLHDSFETYPYLFINAMRGSGKTRLLKIISSLARNGELVLSLKESVLFRDSKNKTLCIDECENIGNKENATLRELLNAGYKKGNIVKRMKKKRTISGEEFEVEVFEPYIPIAMANIRGMEEVLGDRCVNLILEKSSNERVTRLMEDFFHLEKVTKTKKTLENILVSLCRFFGEKGYLTKWNLYVNSRNGYTTTLTTQTTLHTQTTPTQNDTILEISDTLNSMFNKIYDTGINGRDLELMFPLLLISDFLSDELFDKMLEIATEATKIKREEEMVENTDISFLDFVSQQNLGINYISVRKLTEMFREFLGSDIEELRWLNTHWVGRALKRLDLIVDKRRVRDGREVILNVNKACEKIKMFKK